MVEDAPARPSTGARGPTSRPVFGPFTRRQLLGVAGAAAGTALLLAVLTTPVGGPSATPLPDPGATFVPVGEPIEGLAVGDRAPELAGTVDGQPVQLTDLAGEPIRLSDLRGRVVWVNFWASWCPPCQEETPVLQKVHERYESDGLSLVAVSVQETSPDDVRRYVETYDLTYTVGFDATAAVFHTYLAYGLPTQVFIDGEGVIRTVVKGPLNEEQASAIIEPLLED